MRDLTAAEEAQLQEVWSAARAGEQPPQGELVTAALSVFNAGLVSAYRLAGWAKQPYAQQVWAFAVGDFDAQLQRRAWATALGKPFKSVLQKVAAAVTSGLDAAWSPISGLWKFMTAIAAVALFTGVGILILVIVRR